MTSDMREFHDELRAVARDLLGTGPTDWARLVRAGWPGLELPESLGGAGASFAETAIILEELGRAATASRYLGHTLAVAALMALQPNASRDALLENVGAGASTAALVGADGAEFTVVRSPDGLRLSGHADFVPDAVGADHLLVIADDPDGVPVLVDATGLSVAARPVLDVTRRLATVVADDAAVAWVWRFDADSAAAAGRLRDLAAVAVACDSLGLGEAMLAATVDYAKVRHQFGRPIGSFQAVKHACADMLVQVSVARQLVHSAVAVLAEGGDASGPAAMAKSYACGSAVDVVGKAMQLHGGIGYTWESGVHVYLKRAALNRSLFGSPSEHRRRLARRYD